MAKKTKILLLAAALGIALPMSAGAQVPPQHGHGGGPKGAPPAARPAAPHVAAPRMAAPQPHVAAPRMAAPHVAPAPRMAAPRMAAPHVAHDAIGLTPVRSYGQERTPAVVHPRCATPIPPPDTP